MPNNTLNYTRCAVIVHGKSEFALVKYIYTNLHLPVKIISNAVTQIKKGNKSYENYQVVNKANGTTYIRSIADRSEKNNIE